MYMNKKKTRKETKRNQKKRKSTEEGYHMNSNSRS